MLGEDDDGGGSSVESRDVRSQCDGPAPKVGYQ